MPRLSLTCSRVTEHGDLINTLSMRTNASANSFLLQVEVRSARAVKIKRLCDPAYSAHQVAGCILEEDANEPNTNSKNCSPVQRKMYI